MLALRGGGMVQVSGQDAAAGGEAGAEMTPGKASASGGQRAGALWNGIRARGWGTGLRLKPAISLRVLAKPSIIATARRGRGSIC